jgi:hypothetical protein
VLGIDAKAHVQLDGFIELGVLDLLEQGHSLFELVLASFHLLDCGLIFLAWFMGHISSLVQAAASWQTQASH